MIRAQMMAGVAALVCAAGAALATPTLTFNGRATFHWNPTTAGGPFIVTPNSFTFTPGGLGAQQAPAGKFLTFCMERTETIILSGTYNVAFSDKAIEGSAGPGGDPLDFETAFLYHSFIKGTLSSYVAGFTYATAAAATAAVTASANALQGAIWKIEGELGHYSGLTAAEITLADALIAAASTEVAGAWGSSIRNVRVMNLTHTITGAVQQDQLVIIPLPAEATMAGVGLLGVVVGGVVRRRRATASA